MALTDQQRASKPQDLVSVILPAYQAERSLCRAVNSVIAQDCQNWELLIIDDCSKDATPALARQYASRDRRIKVFSLNRNSGPATARNVGLREASGEWVALIDADDMWRPGRLSELLAHAQDETIVADNVICFDDGLQAETGILLPLSDTYINLIEFLIERKGRKVIAPALYKPILRRSFLEQSNLRYDETVRYGEDYLFYLENLCCGGKLKVIANPGYVYTMWAGQKSGKKSTHTHTTANYKRAAEGIERIFSKYRSTIDEHTAFVMRNAVENWRERDAWIDFKEDVDRRRPVASLSHLRNKYVRYRLTEVVRRKLGLAERYWLTVSGQAKDGDPVRMDHLAKRGAK